MRHFEFLKTFVEYVRWFKERVSCALRQDYLSRHSHLIDFFHKSLHGYNFFLKNFLKKYLNKKYLNKDIQLSSVHKTRNNPNKRSRGVCFVNHLRLYSTEATVVSCGGSFIEKLSHCNLSFEKPSGGLANLNQIVVVEGYTKDKNRGARKLNSCPKPIAKLSEKEISLMISV